MFGFPRFLLLRACNISARSLRLSNSWTTTLTRSSSASRAKITTLFRAASRAADGTGLRPRWPIGRVGRQWNVQTYYGR
ncbi:hypothetical protein GGTG_05620 [Gaeumannomyces tritici R3-111a-1]|uniref:Uncharacterized protein n=1 Tax=Gaeumannomyces tritici (strain R3-111a-1) TaxID=644352 RepID=J3NWF6_GAET3|nr:hypothetical protein GGTG_05620 [Gaeumannomyces tritici R3-111a-1]EJT75688.1 hypothetical protein GGTG_05620 [Gaeumannomyces tritici R3-111a-1]